MVAGVMKMRCYVTVILCCCSFAVCAESLQDPTRPPAEIGEGGIVVSGNANARANNKGLLSVIISPTRCAAVIDGKTFKLGDKYGDATLVEIKPQGVVLHSSSGLRSMGLFPGVGVKALEQNSSIKSAICKLENYKTENNSSPKSGLKEKK
jgi:hypothetical protein